MTELVDALLLVIGVAAVSGLARFARVSGPILLVLVGLAASYLPNVPDYELSPEVVLLFFLPLLLYSGALSSSYLQIRANLRPIALLSVGLVVFTAVVVGLVAHLVVPGLPLTAAFTLGAIVAPPDAVAAMAVGRRAGLPRRVTTILEGESLLNDATALVLFRVSVAAVVTGAFSVAEAAGRFLLASVGGVAVGVAVSWLLSRLRRHLDDPLVDNTVSLLTPFLAYLPAEAASASGVIAVVVTGLYLAHRGPLLLSYAARLQAQSVWRMVDFLLEGIVFLLIGLQLRRIIAGLPAVPAPRLAGYAAAVLGTVVLTRVAWVFPATYLPRRLSRRPRERDPSPRWQLPAVVSWAGPRGVVSLAAALAIPLTTRSGAPFPQRNLILFLVFTVILGTLVLQGLSLPAVIRRLGLHADPQRDTLAEAAARHAAARAARERLEELLADVKREPPADVVQRLRDETEVRSNAAWERLGERRDAPETPAAAYRRLRREMLRAERAVFVRFRDEGRLDDEVLRRVQRDLDLEEAILVSGD